VAAVEVAVGNEHQVEHQVEAEVGVVEVVLWTAYQQQL
jgi:hypothetical protein